MVRARTFTPLPSQSVHGSSIRDPVPWQSWQGSLNPNAPWLRLTNPEPLQFAHTRGLVPGLAPEPSQVTAGELRTPDGVRIVLESA